MARTRLTVTGVSVTPFFVEGSGPFWFFKPASVSVSVTRTYTDGRTERRKILICVLPGFETDGASVPWPFSLLVPRWKSGRDTYNAAPVVHDILYIRKGVLNGQFGRDVELSCEECDDVLRGIWRCDGMSRFVAGCADKGVELFAGGKSHWGNDGFGVGKFFSARWMME